MPPIRDAKPQRYARGRWPYVPSAPRRTDTRRRSRRPAASNPCCADVRQNAAPHRGLLLRVDTGLEGDCINGVAGDFAGERLELWRQGGVWAEA